MVIPEGLMERSSPHSFSLGVCKLTMMMECGFMISHSQRIAFRGALQECETRHARRVTLAARLLLLSRAVQKTARPKLPNADTSGSRTATIVRGADHESVRSSGQNLRPRRL